MSRREVSIQIVKLSGWTGFLVRHILPELKGLTDAFIAHHFDAPDMRFKTNESGDLLIELKSPCQQEHANEMREYLASIIYETSVERTKES